MKKILLPSITLVLLIIAGIEGYILLQPTEATHLLSGVASSSAQIVHTEKGEHYSIMVAFPDRTPLYSRINPAADERARTAIETWLQDSIAQFKKSIDFSDAPADYREMIEQTDRQFMYQATYRAAIGEGGKLTSYAYTIFADTGGAHPNTYYHTFVFDRSGHSLAIDDLFVSGSDYLGRLSQEATKQVTAELGKRLDMNPENAIFAEGLSPTADNFKNFFVEDDTLVILIPPYQAAAYVAGTFEVRIPLASLRDILKPEWK